MGWSCRGRVLRPEGGCVGWLGFCKHCKHPRERALESPEKVDEFMTPETPCEVLLIHGQGE
jgi:hypothetical protein